MVSNQIIAISESCGCAGFWWLWQKYRHYLHSCCLKWMGGNPTDAEDALSRAMLKAWEKVQKYAGKISNFKAWLTTLTHNLCMDTALPAITQYSFSPCSSPTHSFQL